MSKKVKSQPKFITVAAVAERFSLSESAVYLGKSGLSKLTKYRFGRSIRFELAEVEAFEQKLLSQKNWERSKK